MDLISLILFCAVSTNTVALTLSHQVATSVDGDPYYIDDLTDAKVYTPVRRAEAVGILTALLEAGHDVRVGLTQLPARRAIQEYGHSPAELIDACPNVAIGTDLLEQSLEETNQNPRRALATYLTNEHDNPMGLFWADSVLAEPAVELESVSSNVENPQPSRRYSVDKRESLFLERSNTSPEVKSSTGDTSDANPVRELFVKPPNSHSDAPKKWKPVEPQRVEAQYVADPNVNSLQYSSPNDTKHTSKKKGGTNSTTSPAQKTVTNERLLTTDELKTHQKGDE